MEEKMDAKIYCDDCPYQCYAYGYEDYRGTNCDIELMKDALELLTSHSYDSKPTIVCSHCQALISDLDECVTDRYWDNEGNHILYHICPICGKSIEETIL